MPTGVSSYNFSTRPPHSDHRPECPAGHADQSSSNQADDPSYASRALTQDARDCLACRFTVSETVVFSKRLGWLNSCLSRRH